MEYKAGQIVYCTKDIYYKSSFLSKWFWIELFSPKHKILLCWKNKEYKILHRIGKEYIGLELINDDFDFYTQINIHVNEKYFINSRKARLLKINASSKFSN
jgi:hypothetical protein